MGMRIQESIELVTAFAWGLEESGYNPDAQALAEVILATFVDEGIPEDESLQAFYLALVSGLDERQEIADGTEPT